MKKWLISLIFILLSLQLYGVELPKPKAGLNEENIRITGWNPPSSLFTHFGEGEVKKNSPIVIFNLNLGFARYYMKSDDEEDNPYVFNPRFTYIAEFKPLDFPSFLTSGSRYSIFMEKNDAIRNITLIGSNKSFASTQLITSPLLWYFDFLYNSVDIDRAIYKLSWTSKSALDNLYPTNREMSFGLSDRFHLFKSPTKAFGIALYFEMQIPKGRQKVITGPVDEINKAFDNPNAFVYSDTVTYSGLAGLFYRVKKESYEMNSQIMYQRLEGDFDDWITEVKQNTLFPSIEVSFNKQFFIHTNYYLIFWTIAQDVNETFYSHTINPGGEIKGFGNGFHWIGVGLDAFYQIMDQEGDGYRGNVNALGGALSLNFYPLAFHQKNHQLTMSFIFGMFNYDWSNSEDIYHPVTDALTVQTIKDSGWNQSLLARIHYSF